MAEFYYIAFRFYYRILLSLHIFFQIIVQVLYKKETNTCSYLVFSNIPHIYVFLFFT